MNALQEEICLAIEGAGLALDDADNGQLSEAIKYEAEHPASVTTPGAIVATGSATASTFIYPAATPRTHALPHSIYSDGAVSGGEDWLLLPPVGVGGDTWSCVVAGSELHGSFIVPWSELTRMRFIVQKQDAAGTMTINLYQSRVDFTTPGAPVVTLLGTATKATVGYQTLTITPIAHVQSSSDTYEVVVIASAGAATNADRLIATEVRFNDYGPYNTAG